ncbi:hypothetical protein ASY01nite_19740 [Acetobacter syzygii]|nr:hypothetical protein Absy_007_065 [Acetobacter syzygii]GEL56908.1 hypothetical protein ASY01nite_19740 [Acetobacter syzygii]
MDGERMCQRGAQAAGFCCATQYQNPQTRSRALWDLREWRVRRKHGTTLVRKKIKRFISAAFVGGQACVRPPQSGMERRKQARYA